MERRSVLKMVAAMPLIAAAPKVEAGTIDHELIAAGAAFEQAWIEERLFYETHNLGDPANDAAFDAAYGKTSALVHQIMDLPVHTVEGVKVKARAISWCHSGAEVGFESTTTDVRLAEQIINALISA